MSFMSHNFFLQMIASFEIVTNITLYNVINITFSTFFYNVGSANYIHFNHYDK